LHTGLVTTSDQRYTVFRDSPKISDKPYTSTKEIQLHRQTKENWTYHFASKKNQRWHDWSLQDNDRQGQNRQGAVFPTGR